jgi:hypothetical protein
VKHVIEADVASSMVTIGRIMDDGSVVFLTSLTFDQVRHLGFDEFARQTGENSHLRFAGTAGTAARLVRRCGPQRCRDGDQSAAGSRRMVNSIMSPGRSDQLSIAVQ